MNLTKLTFEKTQFVIGTIILLVMVGIGVYGTMPRSEDPGYIVRSAQVTTHMPGASPERVEMLVSDKLEKQIQQMPEIDYIRSESKTGISVITVSILEQYTNIRPIWDKLRRKVQDGERELPQNAQKPIVNDEYGDVFGIVIGITWDGFEYNQIRDIAEDVRDELLRIHNIAKVEVWGVQDERVFIDYIDAKLAEVGISPEQLGEILTKTNIINSGGVINTETEQYSVEPTGNFVSVEAIKETLIQIPDTDKIVKLGDIADVHRGYIYPPNQKMRTSGVNSLGIAINMREGGNIVQLGEEVLHTLQQFKEVYPEGIEFTVLNFQPSLVSGLIDDFMENLVQAVLIVCGILLLALGLRLGLIVSSLIPVVIMITFAAMSFFGIGLDQVSLAALMIALGLLVDNSIVMSESTMVMMQSGMEPHEAAIRSAKELRNPLLISSLITSAAFSPIWLAESSTGEYCAAIFLVISITLLISWVISQTLIPVLCVNFLKINKEKIKEKYKFDTSAFYTKYRNFLIGVLKHRWLTLSAVAAVFTAAIFALGFLPNLFFPPSDNPMFTAEIELPVGSSILRSENFIAEMDAYLTEKYEVTSEREKGLISWVTYVGSGGPRYRLQHDPEPPNPFYSYAFFTVTDVGTRAAIIEDLNKWVFEKHPDVKPKIRPLEMGSPVKHPVEVWISGKDKDLLYGIVAQVTEKLESIQGTHTVNNDWGDLTKKLVVHIDEARARRLGLTNEDVATSLEAAFTGISLTEYRERDKLIPTVLRSVVANEPEKIVNETFSIYSPTTGASVPLEQIADVDIVWQPAQIKRRDKTKTITVASLLFPGFTATEVTNQLQPWLEEQQKSWPTGYRWEFGGEYFTSGRASKAIGEKLPVAVVIIILLLMAQFNSVKLTIVVLLTVPLALIGVVIGLFINNSYWGFMTMLGTIALMGMVIVNAIVLLDRIYLEIHQNGLNPAHAIIVSAQKRFRPIVLTAATTVSGLLPLWFFGTSMWEPMSISIIFGLMGATILTLGVLPVIYSTIMQVDFTNYDYDNEADYD